MYLISKPTSPTVVNRFQIVSWWHLNCNLAFHAVTYHPSAWAKVLQLDGSHFNTPHRCKAETGCVNCPNINDKEVRHKFEGKRRLSFSSHFDLRAAWGTKSWRVTTLDGGTFDATFEFIRPKRWFLILALVMWSTNSPGHSPPGNDGLCAIAEGSSSRGCLSVATLSQGFLIPLLENSVCLRWHVRKAPWVGGYATQLFRAPLSKHKPPWTKSKGPLLLSTSVSICNRKSEIAFVASHLRIVDARRYFLSILSLLE